MAVEISNLNVLVVEDYAPARKLVAMLLRNLGAKQVFTAKDGREGQEFLDESKDLVDFIICDWRMPRMTGLELLQLVRSTYPDLPFLMVTANNDIESVKAAKQFGVNAYITKPYSPEQLEQKIRVLAQQL